MTTIVLTVLVILLALAAVALQRVPLGQVYSVYRHGKQARLLSAGTHWLVPLLDRVAHKIDLAGQTLRLEEQADTTGVHGTVYWQVLEPERADAVFEQVDQLIRRGAQEALSAEPTAESVDRRVLGTRLKYSLNQTLRERGMLVTRVDLDAA